MATGPIGPNGPFPLPPASFDIDVLRAAIEAGIVGTAAGRLDHVATAVYAARALAGDTPVLRELELSTDLLRVGLDVTVLILHTTDGSELTAVQVPAGLALNSAQRALSGNATNAGSYQTDIIETLPGAIGSPRRTRFNITTEQAPVGPTLGALSLAVSSAPIGIPVSIPILGTTTGSSIAAVANTLPPGLTVNSVTRRITGTPTASGFGNIVLVELLSGATNSGRQSIVGLTITTSVTPVQISGRPPSTGTVGTVYAFTPVVTNGAGTRTFSKNRTLLAGQTFSTSTGALGGAPTVAGVLAGLVITVTDASGTASTQATDVTIAAVQTPSLDSTLGDDLDVDIGDVPGLIARMNVIVDRLAAIGIAAQDPDVADRVGDAMAELAALISTIDLHRSLSVVLTEMEAKMTEIEAAANPPPVTTGRWHANSRDIAANTRNWFANGRKLVAGGGGGVPDYAISAVTSPVEGTGGTQLPDYAVTGVTSPVEGTGGQVQLPDYAVTAVTSPVEGTGSTAVPDYAITAVTSPQEGTGSTPLPDYAITGVTSPVEGTGSAAVPDYAIGSVTSPQEGN